MDMVLSDLCRGLCFLLMAPLVPLVMALNCLNQQMRRLRGISTSDAWFTDRWRDISGNLSLWNWANIMKMCNCWAILYWAMQVACTKATFVFLSFLNEQLAGWHLVLVIVMVMVVGFTMFMLPPVPGAPVYVVAGIIITARA